MLSNINTKYKYRNIDIINVDVSLLDFWRSFDSYSRRILIIILLAIFILLVRRHAHCDLSSELFIQSISVSGARSKAS